MTGSDQAAGTPDAGTDRPGSASDAAAPPVAPTTDEPMGAAEFAARLDVDPERDDVKG